MAESRRAWEVSFHELSVGTPQLLLYYVLVLPHGQSYNPDNRDATCYCPAVSRALLPQRPKSRHLRSQVFSWFPTRGKLILRSSSSKKCWKVGNCEPKLLDTDLIPLAVYAFLGGSPRCANFIQLPPTSSSTRAFQQQVPS